MKEVGHSFLARMGKKRLRPGGKRGTEWLLAQGAFKPETKVLEVACNMATTAIELAQRYGCSVTACDLDEEVLERAGENVRKAGLEDKIALCRANAADLPFEDGSFDVVLNEAMLTMLSPALKERAVASYYRVLDRGGILLTHDIVLFDESPEERQHICQELSRAINLPVSPLPVDQWMDLFTKAGFCSINHLTGKMTLLTVGGLVRDEGLGNALRVLGNSLKPQNRPTFLKMWRTFMRRKEQLGFIVVASRK